MKNKIMMILIPVLCLLASSIAYLKFINTESDAIKFKKEYEELNGEETSYGTYNKLKISSNNPIKYSSYDEVIDVIKNKTGIIYLGFPNCPWCRTAIPILLDVAEDNDIDTIYYINILNDRDSYVVEDGKLTYELDDNGEEIKGESGYFKLMNVLDDYLSDYIVSFNGVEYNTNEKRIYAPTVIFVRDGEILGIHVSTVETQESGFDKLSDEEEEELYSIYEEYILEMISTTCENGKSC